MDDDDSDRYPDRVDTDVGQLPLATGNKQLMCLVGERIEERKAGGKRYVCTRSAIER